MAKKISGRSPGKPVEDGRHTQVGFPARPPPKKKRVRAARLRAHFGTPTFPAVQNGGTFTYFEEKNTSPFPKNLTPDFFKKYLTACLTQKRKFKFFSYHPIFLKILFF